MSGCHYYDDSGVLNFTVKDRKTLWDIAEALGVKRLYDEKERPVLYHQVINAAAGIRTTYHACSCLGGMGGGMTVEQYLASTPEDPLEAALLPLLREMLEQGILPDYLTLAAVDTLSELLFSTYDWNEDKEDQ